MQSAVKAASKLFCYISYNYLRQNRHSANWPVIANLCRTTCFANSCYYSCLPCSWEDPFIYGSIDSICYHIRQTLIKHFQELFVWSVHIFRDFILFLLLFQKRPESQTQVGCDLQASYSVDRWRRSCCLSFILCNTASHTDFNQYDVSQ